MTVVKRHNDSVEVGESRRRRDDSNWDTVTFIKGVILGFGIAAVAHTAFNLFNELRDARSEDGVPGHEHTGGKMGDLSYVLDESTNAFQDAVKTLDKTFESGIKAVESVQDVIDKIRNV
ncbi:MAG TPA: hypothetical protein VGB30_11215 [bacterium]|jgi:predicted secreted Zn-dependent protease